MLILLYDRINFPTTPSFRLTRFRLNFCVKHKRKPLEPFGCVAQHIIGQKKLQERKTVKGVFNNREYEIVKQIKTNYK